MLFHPRLRMSWMLALWVVAAAAASRAEAQWSQWGGPSRNFTVESEPLADDWPWFGPHKLWKRDLGDGYSSLIYDDGVLYTMYRRTMKDTTEYTVALDATTGKTLWEQAQPAPFKDTGDNRWGGNGPNSTPLVVENRLYTVGSCRVLRCFEKKTGQILWQRDLTEGMTGAIGSEVAYCPSPIAYKNLIIVPLDKHQTQDAARISIPLETRPRVEGRTMMAFDQLTGRPVWHNLDFFYTFSSPILIRFADRDQIVGCGPDGLFAVDPESGDLLWHHPKCGTAPTPVWDGVDSLLFACLEEGGTVCSSMIRLTIQDDVIVPVEQWCERRLSFNLSTPVRVGDMLVGSTESQLLAADWKTGERLWLKRGYPRANLIVADGKLISLDQDGNLKLLRVSRQAVEELDDCQPLERFTFATPVLVGDILYLRDREVIMALDLGRH